eukprot:6080169-Pleurochrysis_carterae.AAC.1
MEAACVQFVTSHAMRSAVVHNRALGSLSDMSTLSAARARTVIARTFAQAFGRLLLRSRNKYPRETKACTKMGMSDDKAKWHGLRGTDQFMTPSFLVEWCGVKTR